MLNLLYNLARTYEWICKNHFRYENIGDEALPNNEVCNCNNYSCIIVLAKRKALKQNILLTFKKDY